MECLALSPVKFTVWSSDPKLISTNILVNAHPKANVARLLQYVRYSIYKEHLNDTYKFNLGNASDYYLLQDSKELNMDISLQSVALYNESRFIKVQFEKRPHPSDDIAILDYDMEKEFDTTNIKIIMNTFSMDKITECKATNLSWNSSFAKIEKFAMDHLHKYEQDSNTKSFCSKSHQDKESICKGFMFKGKQTPTLLNSEMETELINELSLSQLLGVNFTPTATSFFTVMLKMKHDQVIPAEEDTDTILVEFISNANLYMHNMYINSETTVNSAKEYISCVYMHSLSICLSEVKLIYKGRLIPNIDGNNDPTILKELLGSDLFPKIHVQISTQCVSSNVEFWNELFADLMDSTPQTHKKKEAKITEEIPEDLMQKKNNLPSEVGGIEVTPTMEKIGGKVPMEYRTEGSEKIIPTGKLFERCIINGNEEVYIECDQFQNVISTIQVQGETFQVYSQDYQIETGFIKLSPRIIGQIEERFKMNILSEIHENDDIHLTGPPDLNAGGRETLIKLPYLPSLSTIVELLIVLIKTVYFVGINAIAPLFFVIQLTIFLPFSITIPVGLFMLFQVVWNTQGIWDLWTLYIRRHRSISEEQMQLVEERVNSNSLALDFYKECEQNYTVMNDLLMPEIEADRISAYEKTGIADLQENNGVETLRSLFQKVIAEEAPKSMLDRLLKSCVSQYIATSNASEDELELQDSVKEVVMFVYRYETRVTNREQLSLFQNIIITLKNFVQLTRNPYVYTHALEMVVPYPSQDNVVKALLKNLVLFVLVFMPPLRDMTYRIVEQRMVQEATDPSVPIHIFARIEQPQQEPEQEQEEDPEFDESSPLLLVNSHPLETIPDSSTAAVASSTIQVHATDDIYKAE